MEGKILGNRYELLCRVGTGGMAVVYKAKDKILNRFVAVKILREEFKENEEFIRRFNVESQAAASLSHQNIVQIYDVGEEDGLHYIVMEYLEGKTLKEYMNEKGGKLPWREAANFSMQICRALEHAHSKHVVHRDIKPQNIIMTEEGKLKVADFGIARAANNTTTVNSTAAAVGSAHYLSPEQARGGYTDCRSDIYSLGVVMYEMFTGRLPFDADTGVSVIMQHLHEQPEPPCSVNPEIPRGIEAIILKAMNKEQRLRYDNAKDILDDLIAVYRNPNIKLSMLHIDASELPQQRGGEPKKKRPPEASESGSPRKKNRGKKKKTHTALFVGIISALLLVTVLLCSAYVLLFGTGREVKVPKLVGMTYDEAAAAALEASTKKVTFDITVERTEHSDKDKNVIISQTPAGGSAVKRSREIKVVVSSGPVVLELEDYTGKNYSAVKKKLEDKGIKVIEKEENNDTYSEGTIFKQNPKEGAEMAEGDEVTLYVSAGTQNTVVPNVVGSSLEEAVVAIERNNLKVGTVKNEKKNGFRKGEVFNQSRDAFETVAVNTVINLYVATGEKETPAENEDGDKPSPSEQPPSKPQKRTAHLTLSNLPKDREKVTVRLVSDGQTYYEKEFPTAAGSASVSFDITESLSLDVYYDGVYITTKEVRY